MFRENVYRDEGAATAVYVFEHMVGKPLLVETVSVKSEKAAPLEG